MKMKSLEIERQWYGEHEGQYVGTVKFDCKHGDIAVKMSPEVTESFLALAGDLLIAHVEVAGKELQNSIDVAVDKAKLNVRMPEEIARLHAKDVELIKGEGE